MNVMACIKDLVNSGSNEESYPALIKIDNYAHTCPRSLCEAQEI